MASNGNAENECDVLLIGDMIQDRLYLPRRNTGAQEKELDWENQNQWFRFDEKGGVAMADSMMQGIELNVRSVAAQGDMLQSLARLTSIKADGATALPKKKVVTLVGHDPAELKLRIEENLGYRKTNGRLDISGFDVPPEIPPHKMLVISDAGNNLRISGDATDFMKRALKGTSVPKILKMHLPLCKGAAWEAFCGKDTKGDKIVVVQADDLRRHGVPIARCPSWDMVVQDLRDAAVGTGLNDLLRPGLSVIVLFGIEGAVAFTPQANNTDQALHLICDPAAQEGQTEQSLPGSMVGYMNAFLSAFTAEYMHKSDNLAEATQRAMMTMRAFGQSAYNCKTDDKDVFHLCSPTLRRVQDAGRCDTLTKLEAAPDGQLGAEVPSYLAIALDQASGPDLLVECLQAKAASKDKSLEQICKDIAQAIVKCGIDGQLKDLPHGRFGKLCTLNAKEIEALRGIRTLINDYNEDFARSKPMSIAIFGQPGAGKSFGVKQLVDKDVNPVLEINLSQARESDLPVFFQHIRDANLKGKTPLCFFDEFDSSNCGLVKYFLSPMQDGEYRDGDEIRPVGRGIFAFAGGTAESFQDFADFKGKQYAGQDKVDPVQAKIPDFVSRLSGYLNVSGISDPENGVTGVGRNAKVVRLLHRAILTRVKMEELLPDIAPEGKPAAVSKELVNWLLWGWSPKHGARSVETMIRGIAASAQTHSLSLSDIPIDILTEIHGKSV
ncbi:hypothetical protein [uncultured Sulfitobacter sp.]|uniref:hypothetical protein n=1 Tax=uncultured Sulfitobacter sp. TaxID=191468 RepID=UPI00262F2B22|nr:hypothetical protein [uncultured Sulfitobacter sp.]